MTLVIRNGVLRPLEDEETRRTKFPRISDLTDAQEEHIKRHLLLEIRNFPPTAELSKRFNDEELLNHYLAFRIISDRTKKKRNFEAFAKWLADQVPA